MLKVSEVFKIVLVVDDNQQLLLALRDLLEEPRMMVITQRSGSEALQLIRIGMHVDALVVSDNVRDMEVFQLFIALKRLAPSVPVIMLLTPGPDAECLKSLSLGLFEYLEKTEILADLKRAVDVMVDFSSGPVDAGFLRTKSFAACHGSPL